MSTIRRAAARTFHSLRSRSFRLYFTGQVISSAGSWMQQIAQVWLVLRLTDSSVAVGITAALQFTPILVGGAWAGVLVDRLDKRRLLIATAAIAGLLAGVLAILTWTGAVEVWMVYALAFLLGCVTAVDHPGRRSFVPELVTDDDITNAVSLNSAIFTGARAVGPAVAGLVIAGVGIGWCFFLNAVSFGAVIVAYRQIKPEEVRAAPTVARGGHQLRDGLRYAWTQPQVRISLLMVGAVSLVAFNFPVILPVLARDDFNGGAEVYGALMAIMGVGALIGALYAAHDGRASERLMIWSTLAFGVAMLAATVAPTLGLEMAALVLIGATSMIFLAMATAICNERTAPEMRGRIMALFAVAFLGSTPIGGPIMGWVVEAFGPRAGLGAGAFAALAASGTAFALVHRAEPAVVMTGSALDAAVEVDAA